MATPDQIRQELELLTESYNAGKIDKQQFMAAKETLRVRLAGAKSIEFQKMQAGEIPVEDVINIPPPLPRQRYYPGANVDAATKEALGAEVSRLITAGYEEAEAVKLANERISKLVRPATMEFEEQPDVLVSRIVDVEKGLVRDAETGQVRPGTQAELVGQTFLRQPIATSAQYQQMLDQEVIEAQQRQQDMPVTTETGIVDYAKEFYGTMLDPKAIRPYMVEQEDPERSGMVVESFLGASLRNLGNILGFPGVIAAGMEEVMPGTKESDHYKMADSQDLTDQIIVNLAKGQGIAGVVSANKPIVDLIGEDAAFGGGVLIEIGLPLNPFSMLSVPAKTVAKAAGTAPQVVKAPLLAAANPMEYMKLRAAMNMADDVLEKVNAGKSSKDIMKDIYSNPATTDNMIARSQLNTKAANIVGDQIGTVTALQARLNSGKSIPIEELGYLRAKPSVRAIIAEIQAKTGQPVKELTMENAGSILAREVEKYKAAAKADEAFARIYNEAAGSARQIQEASMASKQPNAIRTDALTTDTQSRLAKVVFGRKIAEKGMSKKDIGRLIVQAKKGRDLTEADLARLVLGKEGIDFTTATLDDIVEAVSRNTSDNLRQLFQNVLPEGDLVEVVGGGIVARAGVLKSRSAMKSYFKGMAERNKGIGSLTSDYKYPVKKAAREELIADIIDLKGIDNVRRSEGLRELIDQINNGLYDAQYDVIVRQAMNASVAEETLGAFKLRDAGRQYERARVPEELRGDVFALSEKPEDIFSRSAVVEIVRDATVALKAIVKTGNKSKTFSAMEKVNVPIEFQQFVRNINREVQNLFPALDREIKEAYKTTKDRLLAMDSPGLKVEEEMLAQAAVNIDRTVAKAFGGSYTEYLEQFMQPRFREQIKVKMAQADIKKVQAVLKIGDEALARNLVLDYQLFFNKTDRWKDMLISYYGTSFVDTINIFDYIKNYPTAMTTVSNVRDLTLTNWMKIIEDIDAKFPGRRVLSTIPFIRPIKGAKPAKTVPYFEYILGTRKGLLVSKRQAEMVQSNPSFTVEYYPTFYSADMQINLSPLQAKYKNMFGKVLSSLEEAGVPFNARAIIIDELAETFAERHLSLVRKVSGKTTESLVKILDSAIMGQNNLSPDLTSFKGRIAEVLAPELSLMSNMTKNAVNKLFKGTIDTEELATQVNKVIDDEVYTIFFGGGKDLGKYYADPTLSVMEDTSSHIKSFYLKNGVAVDADVAVALTSNRPVLKQVRNSDFRMAYGAHMEEVFKSIDDMAKAKNLKSTMSALRTASESDYKWLLSYVINALSFSKRVMTNGMLYMRPRFAGNNALTMPFISAMTVGLPRTIKALSPARWGQARMWAQSVMKTPDNVVVFTSKGGRKYTAGELRMLENKTNIGLTRSRMEFYESQATELVTGVQMDLAGASQNKIPSWWLANVSPGQRNMLARMNDQADLVYRRALWYSALADDIPIDQATDMAKRSLLDYGNMSDGERDWANRITLFWSFFRNISMESMNNLAKAITNENHALALKLITVQRRQQEKQGTWLYANDRQKARLFSWYKGVLDNEPSYTFGPINPQVESFESMLGVFAAGASLWTGEKKIGDVVSQIFTESRMIPFLDIIATMISDKYGRNVPDQYVYLAETLGVWDDFRKVFGVTVKDYTKIQSPVYGSQEVQYQFNEQGKKSFALFNYVMLKMGIDGVLRDYTRTIMATGVTPSEMDMQKFANENPFLYGVGITTPETIGHPIETALRARKNLENESQKVINQARKDQAIKNQ